MYRVDPVASDCGLPSTSFVQNDVDSGIKKFLEILFGPYVHKVVISKCLSFYICMIDSLLAAFCCLYILVDSITLLVSNLLEQGD